MWYGFYGETLSSVSGFDDRMDALCREIGGRGRADAVVKSDHVGPSLAAELCMDGNAELAGLRLKELRCRAKAEGIDAALLEDADDSDDPKQALMELLQEHRAAQQAAGAGGLESSALRQELSALRLKELRLRARQTPGIGADALDDAANNDDPKAAVIDLLLGAAAAAAAGQ